MIVRIATLFLNLIYYFFKLLPVRKKITFISRQGNSPSQDALLLMNKLLESSPDIDVQMLFKEIEGKITYFFHMLIQMYHIATSKVVILDSYSIVISLLYHKKELKVVQMWHALGALKKFGYSILDESEGCSSRIAKAMKMHYGYDEIFTSSEFCRKSFAEAFNYAPEKLTVMSLPRVDLLKSDKYQTEKRNEIFSLYPILQQKETIVYAPTFRKTKCAINGIEAIESLINAANLGKYNLIIKAHPLTTLDVKAESAIIDQHFSTMDMLAVADYIILDYSGVTYEAALLGKPLFFYAYDLSAYKTNRNFYVNYEEEMPGVVCEKAADIIEAIETNKYDIKKVKAFADKFVEKQENCTEEMAAFILELIDKKL